MNTHNSCKIYSKEVHGVSIEQIDKDALYVLRKLKGEGFKAYAVGGCVRDLLLGKKPKDFDVTTNARPEQIKKIFRSCLLIGRRFRLAHIRFSHGHIIEVATFRSGDPDADALIVRDNTYGTEEEDAMRRDFTMNGLFYDIDDETIIDYVGGVEDIQSRILKVIGEPNARFRQDPVRMIRLLKFKARLDFSLNQKTKIALEKNLTEIKKSSPARVLEELLRMLESGYSSVFFKEMTDFHLLDPLIPNLSLFLRGRSQKRIYQYLNAQDLLISKGYRLEREALFSSLIYPRIEWDITKESQKTPDPLTPIEILNSIDHHLNAITKLFHHFPRRMRSTITYLLIHQFKITPINSPPSQKTRFLHHADFKLALDFLQIRSAVHQKLADTFIFWSQKFEKISPKLKERSRSRRPKRTRHTKKLHEEKTRAYGISHAHSKIDAKNFSY